MTNFLGGSEFVLAGGGLGPVGSAAVYNIYNIYNISLQQIKREKELNAIDDGKDGACSGKLTRVLGTTVAATLVLSRSRTTGACLLQHAPGTKPASG